MNVYVLKYLRSNPNIHMRIDPLETGLWHVSIRVNNGNIIVGVTSDTTSDALRILGNGLREENESPRSKKGQEDNEKPLIPQEAHSPNCACFFCNH